MKSETDIRTDLRQFFVDNFFMGDTSVTVGDSESFMESGTVDSTGMLEVVMFLENNFGLKLEDNELIPENLDSMDRLVQFISRKQSAAR